MPKKNPLEEQIELLARKVDDLTRQVWDLSLKKEEIQKVEEPIVQEQKFPIPQEYREIVDQTLNRHFGIEITPVSDQPAFMFTIVVPRKYSNLTEEEWNMRGSDLRSKVIGYSEGNNGVRVWAERVFNNFVSELKAQIIADRI